MNKPRTTTAIQNAGRAKVRLAARPAAAELDQGRRDIERQHHRVEKIRPAFEYLHPFALTRMQTRQARGHGRFALA